VLGSVGVVGWGREGQVESEFEGRLDHVGNDAIEQGTDTLKTRVCVDLDEPRLEVFVDHEVQAKNLEIVHLVFGRYLGEHTPSCVCGHFLHLRQYLLLEVVLLVAKAGV